MRIKILSNASVFDLSPKIISEDKKLKKLLEVYDYLYQKYFLDHYPELVGIDRLEELKEWQVDLLAEELHVDFYPVDASLSEKRESVQKSIGTHYLKGTVQVVEEALNAYYSDAKIIPWYLEGGKAGTFSVRIHKEEIRTKEVEELIKLLGEVKRETQHLKRIVFNNNISKNLFYFEHQKVYKKMNIGGGNGNF